MLKSCRKKYLRTLTLTEKKMRDLEFFHLETMFFLAAEDHFQCRDEFAANFEKFFSVQESAAAARRSRAAKFDECDTGMTTKQLF